MQGTVLVVEPDLAERYALIRALEDGGHSVEALADPAEALEHMESTTPDVVLVALDRSDGSGLALLRQGRALTEHASFVAVTSSGDTGTLVEAVQAGADHCLTRPFGPEALAIVVERAMEKPRLAREAERDRALTAQVYETHNFQQIVGAHPAMQRLLEKVSQAAKSRATVLVHGETGTGKELIAAAIHELSRRAHGPFVKLNCAALAESVLESELFGHEKGAFTGATSRRLGRLERASGGTLFLDEVSEIPLGIQVKLLRFLQEKELERVGGHDTVRVDVRIVAATNRDLRAAVADGRFREDLYYRLNVVRLEVPPLRARPSDVPLLADHFLRHYAAQEDKEVRGFDPAAMSALLTHPWPGNVRELQNAVEQAVVLSQGPTIGVDDLPFEPESTGADPLRLLIPGVTLAELERFAILRTLEAVGQSPTRAAKILGISRRTIQYRLQEWGLARPREDAGTDEREALPATDGDDRVAQSEAGPSEPPTSRIEG